MSPDAHGAVSPNGAVSSFTLPAPRRRLGAGGHGAEDPPGRLLLMLAVAFLLASPVITLLLSFP